MQKIPLTKSCHALVDDDDFEWLSLFSWYTKETKTKLYAMTRFSKYSPVQSMHRLIMNAAAGQEVDHEDGDSLNNQKDNLRFSSAAQRNSNAVKRSGASSKYKGVHWDKATKKWGAEISHIYIGQFKTENEAAEQYNWAALQMFGEFARLNVIVDDLQP